VSGFPDTSRISAIFSFPRLYTLGAATVMLLRGRPVLVPRLAAGKDSNAPHANEPWLLAAAPALKDVNAQKLVLLCRRRM